MGMKKIPDLYIDERINGLLTIGKLNGWSITRYVDTYDDDCYYDFIKSNLNVAVYLFFIDGRLDRCAAYDNENTIMRQQFFGSREDFDIFIEKVVEWL